MGLLFLFQNLPSGHGNCSAGLGQHGRVRNNVFVEPNLMPIAIDVLTLLTHLEEEEELRFFFGNGHELRVC